MAYGKVARRTVVCDVAALLDSPEIAALIQELDALRWTGRKGFGSRALIGACLVKSLFALPTWTVVAALIAEHPSLQEVLGGAPSCWACYRFARKLRENRPALTACLDACAASLRAQNPDFGIDVAIDATDLPAWSNGHGSRRPGGPPRERFSDPDASWGHRSAVSTRAAGSFWGHKLHACVCTRTGLPIAWRVETARRHESLYPASLLDDAIRKGFKPETCAMDKAYDVRRVYAECEQRNCEPVVPMKGRQLHEPQLVLPRGGRLYPRIPRDSQRFRDLYRGRGAAERLFAGLKRDLGLTPLRVRGQARVQLHADLTMLARLSLALSRQQELAAVA